VEQKKPAVERCIQCIWSGSNFKWAGLSAVVWPLSAARLRRFLAARDLRGDLCAYYPPSFEDYPLSNLTQEPAYEGYMLPGFPKLVSVDDSKDA